MKNKIILSIDSVKKPNPSSILEITNMYNDIKTIRNVLVSTIDNLSKDDRFSVMAKELADVRRDLKVVDKYSKKQLFKILKVEREQDKALSTLAKKHDYKELEKTLWEKLLIFFKIKK